MGLKTRALAGQASTGRKPGSRPGGAVTDVLAETVGIGSWVRLRRLDRSEIHTVSRRRTDEEAWYRCTFDPLGRALLGRRVGDTVTVYVWARTVAVEIMEVALGGPGIGASPS